MSHTLVAMWCACFVRCSTRVDTKKAMAQKSPTPFRSTALLVCTVVALRFALPCLSSRTRVVVVVVVVVVVGCCCCCRSRRCRRFLSHCRPVSFHTSRTSNKASAPHSDERVVRYAMSHTLVVGGGAMSCHTRSSLATRAQIRPAQQTTTPHMYEPVYMRICKYVNMGLHTYRTSIHTIVKYEMYSYVCQTHREM